MKRALPLILLSVSLAAACATPKANGPASGQVAVLNPADVLPIVAEFSISKAMNGLCQGNEKDNLSPLLEELRKMNASADLMNQADQVITETRATVAAEPSEHVCTPDMLKGAAMRMAAAQESWTRIRAEAGE